MTLAVGYKVIATDLSSVISSINTMATRYGVANYSVGVTAGSTKALNAQIVSMYNILNTCNASVSNATKVTLTDIAGYSVGSLIYPNVLTLLKSKAYEVYSTYCSCDCNRCSCDCDDCYCDCDRVSCACNCDRCTCDCDRCYCDAPQHDF